MKEIILLILDIINDICHLFCLAFWPGAIALFVWLGRNKWLCGADMARWYDWSGYLLWGLIAFQVYWLISFIYDLVKH